MSTYTETPWPIVDLAAVCAVQNLSDTGPLLLNGTLVNSNVLNNISFILNGFIRSVSITSTSNNETVNFTVSGLQNGAYVTETISGVNENTVYGTKYYDIITSIVASDAITAVTVGTGKAGYLPLVTVNTNNIGGNVNYSCSILLPAGSGITYSLFQTLESIDTNWISFQNQSTKFFPSLGLTNMTTSQIGNSTQITNYLLLQIVSSTTPITDTLNFIFLQE